PFAPPDLISSLVYQVDGVRFAINQPAQTVYLDRPWGEQRRLLTIAPAMNVGISPRGGVIPIASSQASFDVHISVANNSKANATGQGPMDAPAGRDRVARRIELQLHA